MAQQIKGGGEKKLNYQRSDSVSFKDIKPDIRINFYKIHVSHKAYGKKVL